MFHSLHFHADFIEIMHAAINSAQTSECLLKELLLQRGYMGEVGLSPY